MSSVNTPPPILKFRDDFSYSSTSTMIAAGWSECSDAPQSYTRVSGGTLTLENDGTTGAAVCWNNIPPSVHDWNITAKGEWTTDSSNPFNIEGSLQLGAKTTSHFYQFEADGFYNHYELYVDGRIVSINDYYTPTLNAWRTFGLAMKNHTLTAYIQGKVELTWLESDSDTDLTMIHLAGTWQTTDSYDYVTANQLLPTTPDFLVYPSPLSQTLSYGATATFTIAFYSINNFNNTILLSVEGSNTTSTPAVTNRRTAILCAERFILALRQIAGRNYPRPQPVAEGLVPDRVPSAGDSHWGMLFFLAERPNLADILASKFFW